MKKIAVITLISIIATGCVKSRKRQPIEKRDRVELDSRERSYRE
jgi:hypothetical protein